MGFALYAHRRRLPRADPARPARPRARRRPRPYPGSPDRSGFAVTGLTSRAREPPSRVVPKPPPPRGLGLFPRRSPHAPVAHPRRMARRRSRPRIETTRLRRRKGPPRHFYRLAVRRAPRTLRGSSSAPIGLWMATASGGRQHGGLGASSCCRPSLAATAGPVSMLAWVFTGAGAILLALRLRQPRPQRSRHRRPLPTSRDARSATSSAFRPRGVTRSPSGRAPPPIAVAFVGYLALFWPTSRTPTCSPHSSPLGAIWLLTLTNILGARQAEWSSSSPRCSSSSRWRSSASSACSSSTAPTTRRSRPTATASACCRPPPR